MDFHSRFAAIVESHTTMKHHHHQFNFMMEIVGARAIDETEMLSIVPVKFGGSDDK
jgi:hypothetical protein